MKIICAGFWKTGTKSLAAALKVLGYKVYDYDDQYMNLADLWSKFLDGTVTDDEIRSALKDVDVLIDGPVIAFWEEIYKAIPEAKVILTVRDEDSWFKSFRAMDEGTPWYFKAFFLLLFVTPTGHHFIKNTMRIAHFCLGVEGPFKLPLFNVSNKQRLYKLRYRKHNIHVINSVPQDRLLQHNSVDGWGPLCKFLNKEIPGDIPYPHKNKFGEHFKSEGGPQNPKFAKLMWECAFAAALLVALFSWLLYFIITMLF